MAEFHMSAPTAHVDCLAATRSVREAVDLMQLNDRLSKGIAAGATWVEGLPMLWLEWDAVDSGWRAPLTFACVTGRILGSSAPAAEPVAAALCGDGWAAIRPAWDQAVRAATSAGATLCHLAELSPRRQTALRLGFYLQASRCREFVAPLFGEARAADVDDLICRRLGQGGVGVQIQLDPSVNEYLGIELTELRSPNRFAQELHLEIARSAAACAPGKGEIVRGWPGPTGHGTVRHAHFKVSFFAEHRTAKLYLGETRSEVDALMRAASNISP